MFTVHLHTKFHMPNTNGSLLIINTPKYKHRFHVAIMLFYILQKFHTFQRYIKVNGKVISALN